MSNNSVYVLGVEAKDVYLANNLVIDNAYGQTDEISNIGYNCTNIKKFKNVLDYSLDLVQMRETYEKVYRNRRFSFTQNNKEYSNRAVVVNFNYAYKEYNKASKNIYIKAGYIHKYIKDKFDDCVCIREKEVIGIRLNEKCEGKYKKSVLDYFIYDDEKKCYCINKANIGCIKTKSELRDYLYENGFMCNGIKFVRDKRSSGSSRVGKCLFIDERLYKKILVWEHCGLKINEGDEIDLAAFESYIALPSSSCIDTLEILPENFLVIDDYESEFEDDVIAVEYQNKQLMSNEKKCKVKNSIFDGESIMDETLFKKYPDRSMLLLRNRFFKSACFKAKIQKWFQDNNIKDVSQLNGFTLAKSIEDIKIITTPSSIKYVKFGSLQQWFDNLYTTFGIVKHEKPTHYLDGKMVQCHYQLLNTLNLSEKDIQELVQPSLDYVTQLRKDSDVLRYHIKYPFEEDITETPANSKNEIIFKLLGMNNMFCKTKMYYSFRNDLVKSMLENYKQGHILINGNYSTLLGNGIEMLQHSIGTFKGESVMEKGSIHSKRFPYNTMLLGSRSPHINSGNVLLTRNSENKLIDEYFDLSKEVVYINAIGENIQQRLNGCDYDSDTVMLTDNSILVNAAKRNYELFKVPTCFVSAKKTKRHYTASDKSDLDCKTGTNKIGEIVNLSQYLQSIMWNNIHKDMKKNKDVPEHTIINKYLEMYRDICILAVMSGIEIDKAKKEFEVNTVKELDRLKTKYSVYKTTEILIDGEKVQNTKLLKPMFFKMITLNNGYELNAKHEYKYFHTPMDYLQKTINTFNFHSCRQKEEVIPFSDILKPINLGNVASSYYSGRDRIIDLIISLKDDINKLYIDYDSKTKDEKEEIKSAALSIKQECVEYINDISIPDITMYLILKEIDGKQHKGYARLIFNTLFGTPNKKFFKLIYNTSNINHLQENDYGTIQIFDAKFIKVAL